MPATVYSIFDKVPVDLRTLPGVTLVVTVPAAFSGTCTNICVPQIIAAAEEIKKAGADLILIVSCDQPDAIKGWIENAKWNHAKVAFASDFGSFELRDVVGKLGDEEGNSALPAALGGLIRRTYNVVKDGKVVWKYTEPDSGKYTLNMPTLITAIEDAAKQ